VENNRPGHISEKGLDGLLNEAFLNLDFENNSKNKEILELVSKNAMHKKSFFTLGRINFLLFLLSVSACLMSFYSTRDTAAVKESAYILSTAVSEEHKKPQDVAPAESYAVKNTREALVENKSASVKFKAIHLTKSKSEQSRKKKEEKIIIATAPGKNLKDSSLKFTESNPSVKNVDSLLTKANADTLITVAQSANRDRSSTPKTPNAKSSKKPEQTKVTTKVKPGKRKRLKLFNGKVKRKNKGSKFLKDSRGKFNR